MKKKLLFLAPGLPYPPHDGGRARLYNLLRYLSRTHEILLLSYVESPHENEYIPALEELGIAVITVVRDESKAIAGELLPRSISSFYTPEMIEKLEHVREMMRPDLVQIDFLVMSQYVNHLKNLPVVYTEHDMSSINFDQSFYDRDLPEKMRFVEWNKLVRFQREILPKFNAVVVLAERDRTLLRGFSPGTKVLLVPTGVDVDYFRFGSSPRIGKKIVFIGNYRHYPNVDAVNHFVKDIFPYIVADVPDALFLLVGSGMKRDFAVLGNEHVKIIGEVTDVRRYLDTALVCVVPVRLGGGVQGKILEAMAAGVPVVATREASSGIECTPGTHIEVAEHEKEFSAKVTALMKDERRREYIAMNARKLVEEKYNWNRIAASLQGNYDSLTAFSHDTI